MERTFLVTCAAGWEGEAGRELRKALPGASVRRLFLRGTLLVTTALSRAEVLTRLAGYETKVVARVVPLVGELAVTDEAESLRPMARRCAGLVAMGPADTFVVQARRRGRHHFTSTQLKQAVARALEEATGATGDYDTDRPDWVVQLEVFQSRVFVGLGRPEDFLQKQVSRHRLYARGTRPLNRAQHKIREAVESFSIPLEPAWRALDIGSAPGGWAAYLAGSVGEVVAVDPAELAPEVVALANVHHYRLSVEEFLAGYEGEPFDLVTNDINVEPELSAPVMVEAARLLRPGGWGVMTVKYTSRRRRQHRQEAEKVLGQGYEDLRFRRLPHNRMEVTVVMRRHGAAFPVDAPEQ